VFVLGRVTLAQARNEALAANQHVLDTKPGLIERMTGSAHTVSELLGKLPVSTVKSTLDNHRTQDKAIRASLGATSCAELTVAACAQLIESVAAATPNTAAKLRSRLIVMCRRGQALGWMDSNPAAVTQRPTVRVQRGRLTLETFTAIHARAAEVAAWLPHAMMLALVSGQDRSTIVAMRRADIDGDVLHVRRRKTSALIDIPLALRLDGMGVTLGELVRARGRVVSPYLVHHHRATGRASAGDPIYTERVSLAFAEARRLAGIEDGPEAPTFHEIRSLSARLYTAQGGVDVQALLGHKSDAMTATYRDARGVEAVRVRVA
jgi:integrase